MSEQDATPQADPLHRAYYQRFYSFAARSSWMQRIWEEAMGDELVPGLDQYSYVTRGELEQIGEGLGLKAGAEVLDMGCGRGGPGLWLAASYGWRLTGVDIAPGAVSQATEFQRAFELAHPARFLEGHFAEIPLAEASMDGVMSVDALWTAQDKVQALKAVAQVMRPGARFAFTHWDYTTIDPVPAFEQSGLKLVERTESEDWLARQEAVYAGILAHEAELREEMGEAAEVLVNEARTVPTYLPYSIRRVYLMEKP